MYFAEMRLKEDGKTKTARVLQKGMKKENLEKLKK